MPQPLSKFLGPNDDWSISFDPGAIQKQPQIASKIAEAIARSSAIDHGLASILVQILHASPEPAFAMFSEVMDASNKRAMILAAAKSSLDPADFEMLEAISSVVRIQTDLRNKLAHWIWGSCEQISNALLLADPRYLLRHARGRQQKWQRRGFSTTIEEHMDIIESMKFDFNKIYVYRIRDFESINRDFEDTQSMIGNFNFMISPETRELQGDINSFQSSPPNNIISEARLQLSKNRLFADSLKHLRKKRQLK